MSMRRGLGADKINRVKRLQWTAVLNVRTRVLSRLTSRRVNVSDLAMTGTRFTRSCKDFISSMSTWRRLQQQNTYKIQTQH